MDETLDRWAKAWGRACIHEVKLKKHKYIKSHNIPSSEICSCKEVQCS